MGVRSVEDEETVRLLAERKITLDVCPVSNVKLRVAPSFREHPLKKLIKAGVPCTINRDDPLIFGSTLEEEYFLIQEEMNLADDEIVSLVRNGFETALVEQELRDQYHRELDDFLTYNNLSGVGM